MVLEKEYVLNKENQLYTALKKSASRRKLYIYVSAKEYGFFEGKARPQMPEVNPILLPDMCTCEVRPQNKSRQEGKVCVCVLWRVNSRTASVNLVALNSTHMAVTLPSAEPLYPTAFDSRAVKSMD